MQQVPSLDLPAVAGPTRKCAATGRELAVGDKFVAVLTAVDGKYVRTDYAADAWTGPPADAVAFWAGRVPAADKAKRPAFDDDHLAGLFAQLANAADPARRNLRYAVALLLMRRKRLKFEDAKVVNGTDVLVVRDARSGQRSEVIDPRLSADEIAAVQDQVFAALGWE